MNPDYGPSGANPNHPNPPTGNAPASTDQVAPLSTAPAVADPATPSSSGQSDANLVIVTEAITPSSGDLAQTKDTSNVDKVSASDSSKDQNEELSSPQAAGHDSEVDPVMVEIDQILADDAKEKEAAQSVDNGSKFDWYEQAEKDKEAEKRQQEEQLLEHERDDAASLASAFRRLGDPSEKRLPPPPASSDTASNADVEMDEAEIARKERKAMKAANRQRKKEEQLRDLFAKFANKVDREGIAKVAEKLGSSSGSSSESGEASSSSGDESESDMERTLPKVKSDRVVDMPDQKLRWLPKDLHLNEFLQFRFQLRPECEAFYLCCRNWEDPSEEKFKWPAVCPAPSTVRTPEEAAMALAELRSLSGTPRLAVFAESMDPQILETALKSMIDGKGKASMGHFLRKTEKELKKSYSVEKTRTVPSQFQKRVSAGRQKEEEKVRKTQLTKTATSGSKVTALPVGATPSTSAMSAPPTGTAEKSNATPSKVSSPIEQLHARVQLLRTMHDEAAKKGKDDLAKELKGLEEFRIGALGSQAPPELLELQSLAFVVNPIAMLDERRCKQCGDLHTKIGTKCKVEASGDGEAAEDDTYHADSLLSGQRESVGHKGRGICQYALCEEKHSHSTRVCPTLHAKCGTCLFRGHTSTSRSAGKLVCPQTMVAEDSAGMTARDLGRHFEEVANLGILTQYRRQHPPLGFFSFAGKAEAAVLTSLTFENLCRAGLSNVADLCQSIRASVRSAMAGIGDRSKEYERNPAQDLEEAEQNILKRRDIVKRERHLHCEAIQHQTSVVDACDEFLELDGVKDGQRNWAKDRISEAIAAIKKSKSALTSLLVSQATMERGSAQASWSVKEVADLIGDKANKYLERESAVTKPSTSQPATYASAISPSLASVNKRTTEMPPPPTPPKVAKKTVQRRSTVSAPTSTSAGSSASSDKSKSTDRSNPRVKKALTSGARRNLSGNARFWVDAFDKGVFLQRESDLPPLTQGEMDTIPDEVKEEGTSFLFKYPPLKGEKWIKVLDRFWAKWAVKSEKWRFLPSEFDLKKAKARQAASEDSATDQASTTSGHSGPGSGKRRRSKSREGSSGRGGSRGRPRR